jgi:hypothetical protein
MYINYLAVLVATIAAMIIGSIWYAPPVFGNAWMRLSGRKGQKMDGGGLAMLGMFIASLVTSYVLAHFVGYMNAATWWEGVQLGIWIWLGFLAAMGVSQVFFEKRPFQLFLINTLNQLVTLIVMGAILACWQ